MRNRLGVSVGASVSTKADPRQGSTAIESLIVLALSGMLAAIAYPGSREVPRAQRQGARVLWNYFRCWIER